MYIAQVFRIDPLAGMAVLLCLATIFWCLRVVRRRQAGADRFLLGLLGLVAISQGLRILNEAGIWIASQTFHRLDDVVNLATAGLYLIGALLLEISSRDRITAQVGFRLLEANSMNEMTTLQCRAGSPMLLLAGDGRVMDCNRAAEEIFGRQRNEIIGTKPLF